MVTARKPTTHTTDLLALFRRELEYRIPSELLVGLVRLNSMKSCTRGKVWALLDRPERCTADAVSKIAEVAIREMDATEVEAWLNREAADRAEAQVRHARSKLTEGFARLIRSTDPSSPARAQKFAAILDTARRVDAALPIAPMDRALRDEMGATERLLVAAIDFADQAALAKMLEVVLLVATDRVVDELVSVAECEADCAAGGHAQCRMKRSAA